MTSATGSGGSRGSGGPAGPGGGRPRVAVVGGGITGLAAAWELATGAGAPVEVIVLEGSAQCGGKLRSGEIAGVAVDEGAEQVLLRRPEATTLLTELGLAGSVVHPVTSAAGVLVGGRLHPLPPRTLLGVPTDVRALRASGVLGPAAVARVQLEPYLPGRPPEHDVAVGPYLAARLGRPLVDRLVEPLLGGVYAGHADRLSLAATMPQLWAALRERRSVVRAARSVLPAPVPASGSAVAPPAFGSLPGGLGRLVPVLLDALAERGVTVRTGATVRELARRPGGRWALTVGPTRAPEEVVADAVVLAVPARPAARLLGSVGDPAWSGPARRLEELGYASMVLVTLAFDRLALSGSGFLVPPGERRAVKASTFASVKWGRPGPSVVRLSYGRHGEEADLQRDDAELVRRAVTDLADITGATGRLLDSTVVRWGGGLPQPAPGHLELVSSVRAALASAPALALAGAAYDGVGVPACIGSGRTAARSVRAALTGAGTLGA
jgi:oxygen-dependent protoporphyrinogen oxidase